MYAVILLTATTAPAQYCPPIRPAPAGYGCNGGAYRPAPPPRPRGRSLDLSFEDGDSRLQLRLGPRDGNGNGPAPGIRERRGAEEDGELEYLGPSSPMGNGEWGMGNGRRGAPDQYVSARRSRLAVCQERRRVFASSYRAGYYPAYFRP